MFRRSDHWLKSDTYCVTVDEALSEDTVALNGSNYISDGLKRHRVLNLDDGVMSNYAIGQITVQILTPLN